MARCPFLIVEKDGSHNYRYRCKVTGRNLGDFYDKREVDSNCDKKYEYCTDYKRA